MHPHRDRLGKIRTADDNSGGCSANAIPEDHETSRDIAVKRNSRLGSHRKRANRRLAEARHRVRVHRHERHVASGCSATVGNQQCR